VDDELLRIGGLLLTQDNLCTEHPMFCVQQRIRDVGFDVSLYDQHCWHNRHRLETIYDDDPGFTQAPEGDEWEEHGYRDRWETVMVAFTRHGCEDYIRQNGHNHPEGVRIYVESFRRCQEMIYIREWLMNEAKKPVAT
jgi:hypothetical protein